MQEQVVNAEREKEQQYLEKQKAVQERIDSLEKL